MPLVGGPLAAPGHPLRTSLRSFASPYASRRGRLLLSIWVSGGWGFVSTRLVDLRGLIADLYLFVGRGRLVPVLPLYEGPERGYRPRPEDGVDGFRDGNPARSRIPGNLRPATASAAGGGLQGGWTVAALGDA